MNHYHKFNQIKKNDFYRHFVINWDGDRSFFQYAKAKDDNISFWNINPVYNWKGNELYHIRIV